MQISLRDDEIRYLGTSYVFRAFALAPITLVSSLVFLCPFYTVFQNATTPANALPHPAPSPHFTTPTNPPGQPDSVSRRYTGPVVCLKHTIYQPLPFQCTPGKTLFPACFSYPDINQTLTQFRSDVFPFLFLLLRATGFPVTHTEPAPRPHRPPASGNRVPTHLFPRAYLWVPVI